MLEKNNIEYIGNKRTELIIKFIMFTASLTGLALLSSFYPVVANTLIIIIPSIIVIFYSKPKFFEKLKLITLLSMRVLIIFAALRLFNPQIYIDLVLLMLIVNILETTLTDLLKNKKIYNAISGFTIAAGVLVLKGAWAYGSPIGNYYVVTGVTKVITILFIVAYSIWRWIFTTNENSCSISLLHIGMILVPIIGSIITVELGAYGGLGLWLILTANSLTIGLWIQIAAKRWFENEFYSKNVEKFISIIQKKPMQITIMILNILLIVIAVIISVQNDAIGYHLSPFAAPIK